MGREARANKLRRVVQTYLEVAPAILGRYFKASCCLNATSVFCRVMKAFNVPTVPTVTEFVVRNKVWMDRFAQNDGPPDNEEMAQAWVAAGGWAIGINKNSDGEGWPHHIVALAEGILVDSSAGQVNRPTRGINIPQVLGVPAPETWPATFENTEGTVITYYLQPGVPYEHLSGWNNQEGNVIATAEIIEVMLSENPALGRLLVRKEQQ